MSGNTGNGVGNIAGNIKNRRSSGQILMNVANVATNLKDFW